eukprot:gene6479-11932_t
MDETSDLSGQEQISFCIRIANDDFSIEEIFFGLYETSITTSDALFTILEDVLLRMQLDITKCRGQCYDGAANVSGHVTVTAQGLYRQKYFTILDSVLVGLTDRFEPDETSEHLKRVEQFLTGEEKSVDYIKQYYGKDVDGPRSLLHRDMLIDRARCQEVHLEDIQCVVDFSIKDELFRSMVTEVNKLVRMILTLPVSSCTA